MHKMFKVIKSCETHEQLKSAMKMSAMFCHLTGFDTKKMFEILSLQSEIIKQEYLIRAKELLSLCEELEPINLDSSMVYLKMSKEYLDKFKEYENY